jgi:hypothetical protein
MVATLVAISGKDAELCAKALQAAFGDADRAFEYLTNGIPQNMAGAGVGAGAGMGAGAGAYAEEEGSYEGDPAAGMD